MNEGLKVEVRILDVVQLRWGRWLDIEVNMAANNWLFKLSGSKYNKHILESMQSLISISVFEIKNILETGGNSIIIFLSIIIKQCPYNNILDYPCSIFLFLFIFLQLVLVLWSMAQMVCWLVVMVWCKIFGNPMVLGLNRTILDTWQYISRASCLFIVIVLVLYLTF